jgi:hypothetical protein
VKVSKPNFFLIGAIKSGTTSLFHYLKQHPDIFMCPIKEPRYFVTPDCEINSKLKSDHPKYFRKKNNAISNLDDYLALFQKVKDEKVIGEASPIYLVDARVAERIHKFCPEAKLLVILRNPFDAAYATYKMIKRMFADENRSFLEMLQGEDVFDDDYTTSPRLIRSRFYDFQLNQYFKYFPRNQIKIVLYEDLKENEKLFESIFKFLEIDHSYLPDTNKKYNVEPAAGQRSLILKYAQRLPIKWKARLVQIIPEKIISRLQKTITYQNDTQQLPAKCPEDAKKYMFPILQPHIIELQKQLGRDLKEWLK